VSSLSAAAVVGVGLAGENHLRALTALGIPIAGLLSARQQRTSEAAARWRTRAYLDLRELLADNAATVVHVCVPPASHRPLVEAAVGANRHVLCEKPLAMSRAEARSLVEQTAATGCNAWVGFNRRFDAGVQLLRQAVRTGDLGEPINIWGSYQQQWNAEPSSFDWRFDPEVVGRTRVVGDIGAHWLDLASHVLGSRLRRVSALISDPRRERDLQPADGQTRRMLPTNEDAFAALLEYENGVTGSVHATQLAYGSWDDITLRVDGSRRSGGWDSRHPNQAWFADKRSGVQTVGLDSPGRSFEAMIEEVYARSSGGIAATFEDGRHNNASIDAILDSGREYHSWVEVERP
jgi:predicted dehydrogenase